jgi:hypothetical protein
MADTHLESIGLLFQKFVTTFSGLLLPFEDLLVHTRGRDFGHGVVRFYQGRRVEWNGRRCAAGGRDTRFRDKCGHAAYVQSYTTEQKLSYFRLFEIPRVFLTKEEPSLERIHFYGA